MILYAYRFLYNFYGLISVSGFADVEISFRRLYSCCKNICNMLNADFAYAKYSYFIDFPPFWERNRDTETQRTVNDRNHLKMCAKS